MSCIVLSWLDIVASQSIEERERHKRSLRRCGCEQCRNNLRLIDLRTRSPLLDWEQPDPPVEPKG